MDCHADLYKKDFGRTQDIEILLIVQCRRFMWATRTTNSGCAGDQAKPFPEKGATAGNEPMEQAPPTLDAYLDGVAPSLPQGNALADVVSRLAKAAVEL